MTLRGRLALLMVLLILLPSLPAVWVTRALVERSLNLGLSAEVADALEAGVRQARENYQLQRSRLTEEVVAWAGNAGAETLRSRAAEGGVPGDHMRLVLPDGTEHLLADAPVLSAPAPPAEPGSPGPPRTLEVAHVLPDGATLHVRSRAPEAWRTDAATLAATLQVMRGLQIERERLERRFWLPFVFIYGAALLAALIAAGWIGRGITAPVERLLSATRAVAAGRWDVQVPAPAPGGKPPRDEIARLGTRFNQMVRTLDVQSRRLVDLEKMAGWREMARALAHEVKNPLTPIQLTVEEIRERYAGDDSVYRDLLEECTRIIINEVESLRQVVTRFREFSRPVEPRFTPVDLNELVSEVAALQRDLHVELDLAPDLGNVLADPDRLRQALMNLARNAQTATRETTSPRLRLATRAVDDRIAIFIEDNGPGIPPDQRERVFEPYRSGSAGGLGLGLALVKGIVLAHGGDIEIGEGAWGGARFRLELPRKPEGEERHG